MYSALSGQDSVYTLQTIEVTSFATGITNFQSFYLIDSSEIRKGETGLSLEESFFNIPGLIISSRNNPSLGDKISVRGIGTRSAFGIRGIKILLDNIPLTLPDGQSQTNNIDLFSAGRIEILKGPSSSLFGNASGGVIKIQSEIPADKIFSAYPSFIYGEDNLMKYSLKMEGSYLNHSYLVSFNNLRYDGSREHSSRNIYQLNTVYKNKIAGRIKLTAVLNYFNSPYLLNPGSLNKAAIDTNRNSAREFVKQQGAGEKADQLQGGITLNFSVDGFTFEAAAFLLNRDLLNPIPGRIIDLKRNSGGIRSLIRKEFSGNEYEFNLAAGIDIEFQNDIRKEYENNGLTHLNLEPQEIFDNLNYGSRLINQEENVTVDGSFLSAELEINNKYGFMTGLRYDNYSFKVDDFYTDNSGKRYMDHLSPSAGIFFRPNLYSRFYFNYSTSFQTPTTSELSNRPGIQGGFNPDLKPEKVYQLELGAEYIIKEINSIFSAAVYFMNFSDLLIPYQIPGSEEVFFRNAGKAENSGAEITMDTSPLKNFSASFSFSFMNFVFKNYEAEYEGNVYQLRNNKVPGVPKQVFSAQFRYIFDFGVWTKLKFYRNDDYYTNDFNGAPPGSVSPQNNFINESYFKIDFRTGYIIKMNNLSPEIFFGINNLLNEKYSGSVIANAAGERYFEPSPERTWYLGIQFGIF